MDALEKLSIYEAQNMVPSDESVKKSPGESLTNNQVALDRLKEENQEKDSIIEALQQENLRLKKIEENTAHKTSKTKFIRQSTSPSILQTSRTTPSTSFHRGGSFTMDIAEFPLSTDRFDSDSFYGPNNSLSVDSHAPHTHYWKEQFEEAIVMRKQCRSPPPVSKVTRPKRVLFQGPQVKSKGTLLIHPQCVYLTFAARISRLSRIR